MKMAFTVTVHLDVHKPDLACRRLSPYLKEVGAATASRLQHVLDDDLAEIVAVEAGYENSPQKDSVAWTYAKPETSLKKDKGKVADFDDEDEEDDQDHEEAPSPRKAQVDNDWDGESDEGNDDWSDAKPAPKFKAKVTRVKPDQAAINQYHYREASRLIDTVLSNCARAVVDAGEAPAKVISLYNEQVPKLSRLDLNDVDGLKYKVAARWKAKCNPIIRTLKGLSRVTSYLSSNNLRVDDKTLSLLSRASVRVSTMNTATRHTLLVDLTNKYKTSLGIDMFPLFVGSEFDRVREIAKVVLTAKYKANIQRRVSFHPTKIVEVINAMSTADRAIVAGCFSRVTSATADIPEVIQQGQLSVTYADLTNHAGLEFLQDYVWAYIRANATKEQS